MITLEKVGCMIMLPTKIPSFGSILMLHFTGNPIMHCVVKEKKSDMADEANNMSYVIYKVV